MKAGTLSQFDQPEITHATIIADNFGFDAAFTDWVQENKRHYDTKGRLTTNDNKNW